MYARVYCYLSKRGLQMGKKQGSCSPKALKRWFHSNLAKDRNTTSPTNICPFREHYPKQGLQGTLSVSLPTPWERSKVGHWILTRLPSGLPVLREASPTSHPPGHWLSMTNSCFCPGRTRKHISHLENMKQVAQVSPLLLP